MKKITYLIGAIFLMLSCTTSKDVASVYDDVYYTPKSNVVTTQAATPDYKVTYNPGAQTGEYQQSTTPESQPVESGTSSDYQDYKYSQDYYPESSSQEYYYPEGQSDTYSDYSYEARINRFYGANVGFGYYDPFYSGCCSPYYGSSFSMGFGWGYPYSSFSIGFGWGWGYPYYSPWYYNPWYSWGYYPYYNPYWYGSYWNGYWDGYYAGGGGYYPNDPTNNNYYYGPRNPRGSSIIGSTDTRTSRIASDEDATKTSYISGRTSRTSDGTVLTGQTAGIAAEGRSARTIEPQTNDVTTMPKPSPEARTERIAKPQPVSPNQEVAASSSRNVRDTQVQPPQEQTTTRTANPAAQPRQGNNVSAERYSRPQVAGRNTVYSQERKYAKPQSNDLDRPTGTPKTYTAPNTNRPRSSNEYVVPNSRTTQNVNRQQETRQAPVTSPGNTNTRVYSTPSRSENQFSQPARNASSPVSTPSRITTPPSSTRSVPSTGGGSSRSYSAPTSSPRSSGSYSAPASSGGSTRSSSGSSSGGSSGGSTGGRGGR